MIQEQKAHYYRPKIAITIGDINGIGPEVIIRACDGKILQQATIIIYGHGKVLSHFKKELNLDRFSFHQLNEGDRPKADKLNVINSWKESFEINIGEENETGGKCALTALQHVVKDLKDGKVDAVVTAPINKNNIQSESFQFAGHTEFFTESFGHDDSLMLLCNEHLKVGVATGHIPLMSIQEKLTPEVLKSKTQLSC